MAPFIDPQNLLHPDELAILQAADACPYEISYAKSLGDIHEKVPVYILAKRDTPMQRKVVVGEEELNELQERARREKEDLFKRLQEGDEERENLSKYMGFYERVMSARPGENYINTPNPLGEFIDDKKGKRVHLYIQTIREEAGRSQTPATWLLAQVYAHEMHHAAYHTQPSLGDVNTFIEEPMDELGMLQWAKVFEKGRKQYQGFHANAIISVSSKKYALPEYGFGEYIFGQDKIQPQMLVVAGKPLMNSPLIRKYSLPFRIGAYPWPHEEEYAELLWRILHNQKWLPVNTVGNPTICNEDAIDGVLTDRWQSRIFSDPYTTFCDLFYLSDDFVNVIEEKLMTGLAEEIPDEKKRRQHIREKQIFRRKDSVDVYQLIKELSDAAKGEGKPITDAKMFSYFQSLTGANAPTEPFTFCMGLPPFYKTVNGKNEEVWQDAVWAGFSLMAERGFGIFCTPADWYYYGISRDNKKRKFWDFIINRAYRIYDSTDSKELLPQHPVLQKGACIINITRLHYDDMHFVTISSNGTLFSQPRATDIIIRDYIVYHIWSKYRQRAALREAMIKDAQSEGKGTYTIQLNRTLKRVDGKFRMVKQTGIATNKNTNTITIHNRTIKYPFKNPIIRINVPDMVLDAFFESELATFIVMTCSGITKNSYPTVTMHALSYLPNIINAIFRYVHDNGAGILSQPCNDRFFYWIFELTNEEIAHVRDTLKCN